MEATSAEALLAEAGSWLRASNISLPASLTSVLDTADLATTSGSLAYVDSYDLCAAVPIPRLLTMG